MRIFERVWVWPALLTVVGGLQGCASTPDLSPGNPLPGVGLEAVGTSVLFSWAPESPLGRHMRPNTPLQLVATYASPNGTVRGEPVATTRVSATHSGVKFNLAPKLNNIATGEVCLRVVHNRRPIPIRIARLGESSDGFQYPEWVEAANQQRRLLDLERDKERIDRNVENFRAGDPNFLEWRNGLGLASEEDCVALSAADTTGVRPKTAIEGPDQSRAASEHCVALLHDIIVEPIFDSIPSLSEMRPGLTTEKLAQDVLDQVSKKQRIITDAQRLAADTRQYGRGSKYFEVSKLPLNAGSVLSLWVRNRGEPSASDAANIVEAYTGCIDETVGRFEQAVSAWNAKNDQNLRKSLDHAKQQECRARFESYRQIESRLAHWLDQQRENVEAIGRAHSESAAALPTRKTLIRFSCALE